MLLEDKEKLIPDKFRSLTDLTDFAVHYRYESYDDFGAEMDREAVIGTIQEFLTSVQQFVKRES